MTGRERAARRPPGSRPRRWGLYGVVAVALLAAYAVAVPQLWRASTIPTDGPLALTAPPLADGERVTPGGPTAGEIVAREIDEWDTCAENSRLTVVGGPVDGRPYVAVYDVVDGEVCAVTIREGDTGDDLDPDGDGGRRVTDVAKRGGAWPWLGPVNTPLEMWLGFAAVGCGVVVGGFLGRRDMFRVALEGEPAVVAWPYRFLLGGSGLVLLFANIDVLAWPDPLGYVAIGLIDAAWAWGFAGGWWLLSPSIRTGTDRSGDKRRRGGFVRVRSWLSRLRPGRRPSGGPAIAGGATTTSPVPRAVPRFRVTPTRELPHFGQVGGMDDVKAQLEDTLGLLLAFADEARDYRITFNGLLLHGPPGTGKTFLAKAVAGEFGLSFVHVTAADLVSKYVGETARNVEAAFQTAAANIPCLLFFDEFDAIGARRDDDANAEDRRAVAQLLTSLERHRSLRDLVVMAATNDLDRLDPAVIRPGRFDRHIRIDLPDDEGREAILRTCLAGRPAYSATDLGVVVRRTAGFSAASLAGVVEAASLSAFREATTSGRRVRIGLAHLLAALDARGGKDRPTVEEWTWDRLVLPAAVKAELQQVQALVEDPERARRYGVRPPSGMLLAGPPGTGKTTIARVFAAQARCSFYPVTVADLTSKWVGESEDTVARLFSRARENAPSIIFLDEIDAVAGRRSPDGAGHEQRLLNQLLAEIDGIGGRGDVFVLAATNRPDSLDEALVRGGRLSRTLWIDLPDEAGRRALLRMHSAGMPLDADVDLEWVAGLTAGWSGADLEALCQQAAVVAMTRATQEPVGAGGLPAARVRRRDVDEAFDALRRARERADVGNLGPREHLLPPPGVGGS